MRTLWLIVVVLVVGGSLVGDLLASTSVSSAMQASQLADQTAARMLMLIALTLAFWFVADGHKPAPRQLPRIADAASHVEARPGSDAGEGAPSLTSTTCKACGEFIESGALQCRHCLAWQR